MIGLASKFEKSSYLSENNEHGESYNESSSMSLRAGNALIGKLQASVAPPASPDMIKSKSAMDVAGNQSSPPGPMTLA